MLYLIAHFQRNSRGRPPTVGRSGEGSQVGDNFTHPCLGPKIIRLAVEYPPARLATLLGSSIIYLVHPLPNAQFMLKCPVLKHNSISAEMRAKIFNRQKLRIILFSLYIYNWSYLLQTNIYLCILIYSYIFFFLKFRLLVTAQKQWIASSVGRGPQPPAETPLIAAVLNLSLLLPCQPFINVVALLNLYFLLWC